MINHSQSNGFIHHLTHPGLQCNRGHDIMSVTSHPTELMKNIKEMEKCVQHGSRKGLTH